MPKRVSVKGKGADLFFGDYDPGESATATSAPASANGQSSDLQPETLAVPAEPTTPPAPTDTGSQAPAKGPRAKRDSQRTSRPASPPADEQASALASMLASVESETIEAIRKVVKTQGREVSFIRLTPEEKA